ncbi:hypothetical protein AA103196_1158 [Ameyamaea chiangmaiensis NBRC 103196]|uniref:M61 family metallopeptidase n=1 Tax=Ameyamaea chiangmaiensis TaxID=442969 RepID=A0A850PB04_9PROT|nr:M61 family metallopeptidase [Ameyamaea chiangmaiensis]MBS4075074.1 M61 family metallopeptidase [Ameyamaea chiangmaiensis]NVN41254.1 M61 family metallopeptidase [Ameyamaea chiangmaiensis]GBQ65566.1 hypothetical protein AA103196_1158 [Ameyamaea chiangmaiensis NBRC 103196]
MSRLRLLTTLGAFSALVSPTFAQPQPAPLPMPPTIAEPRDTPFPGTLTVSVDATDTAHHVLSVHETISVPKEAAQKGEMVVLYPMWIPGDHSPTGVIEQLASLRVEAAGKAIAWTRDTVNVAAFHIPVSATTATLDLHFQILTPVTPKEGRVVMTPSMVNVQWDQVSLYPAGYFTRGIPVEASVKVPHGWQIGTALRSPAPGDETRFNATTYNTLVDSPLYSGRYFRKFDLTGPDHVPVTLNVMADDPDSLNAKPEQIEAHKALVKQATALFRSHHYDHYDFLLALTDELGMIGLEHHQSSENAADPGYFTEWDKTFPERDLLAHEYTHSWNGKYRRPADLWAANFNTPQRGSLLWVYEGQTQYWGNVLAARSGLVTKEQGYDALAYMAASYDNQTGRVWRPLEDTTNDPVIAQRTPLSWRDWQRSEDYYVEGQLVWLDADTLIRKLSDNRKSLNDFAGTFFATNNASVVTSPYTFDDVVAALNNVQPYDWAKFLHDRLDTIQPHAPLDGLKNGGYALVYTDEPTSFIKAREEQMHMVDVTFSLGMIVKKDGTMTRMHWMSPAYKAGLTSGETIIAVNDMAYTDDRLRHAIKDAHTNPKQDIRLVVKAADHVMNVTIPYHDGPRYPHLRRIDGTPDYLGAIYAPL